jgi:iron complex outermembrane recepter protein
MVEASKRVKLIGGARWERISVDTTLAGATATTSSSYDPVTGRLGVVLTATNNVNVYASYSRAIEPVNQFILISPVQRSFSLSPGRQWEFGTKGTAWRGRIDTTLAYFDIEKSDILTSSIVAGRILPQQIGRQIARGVELSLVVHPTAQLDISGDLALTHAAFTDFTEVIGSSNISRDGNQPPNVPENVWNLRATHRVGQLSLTGSVRHVGTRFADTANLLAMDKYTTLDAGASYRVDSHLTIMFRARNLTDQLYSSWAASDGTALLLDPPRSADITLSVAF